MASKYDQLLREYRKLAKRADQRLVRLEKLSTQENFRSVKKFAYARAMRDIKTWSGEGATRFNTKPPKSVQGLKAKIADIEHFLEPGNTSTKTGIVGIYKRKQATVLRQYGLEMSWQDAAKLYETGLWDKLDSAYGSKTVLLALGEIRKNIDQINALKNKVKNVQIVEDRVVDRTIKSLLSEHKKDLKKIGIL